MNRVRESVVAPVKVYDQVCGEVSGRVRLTFTAEVVWSWTRRDQVWNFVHDQIVDTSGIEGRARER